MAPARVMIGLPIPDRMAAAYSYFAAAAALGFDREEDLVFDFIYPDEPGTTARALAAGRCQFAPLNTTVGLLAHDEGLPLRAVYSMSRRTHRWFAVLPGSPITSLAQLRGRSIACDFPHLQTLAESALAEEGIDRNQFTWVPWRGSGMEAGKMIAPLQSGDVDAVFLIDWNDGDFIAEGLQLRRLPSKGLDRIRMSSCLWLASSDVEKDGGLVGGVGRAMAKVTVFALENPAAVIELMWERCPDTRPREGERERELRRGVEIVRARLDTLRLDDTTGPRWGALAAEDIVAWQDFLLAAGAISHRLDPEIYYNASFVDRFNDFDPEAVRASARAFRGRNGRQPWSARSQH
jgi:NitT/TauT family transport system substrate-binding protein